MIILRYLTQEVSKSLTAVFLVLTTIFMSQKFVQQLADASDGEIPGFLVLTIVSLKLPALIGLLLPLSMFLGVLLAYGRIYAESEMTVLHACGISEWYITRVTLAMSLVVMLITAVVTVYVGPWAKATEYDVLEKAKADAGLSTLTPGRFQKVAGGNSVVFVHSIDNDTNEYQKVFVAQTLKDESEADASRKRNIVYALKGRVVEDEYGAQTLVLEDGRRYESDGRSLTTHVTEFKRYSVQILEQQVDQKRRKLTAVATEDLLDDPDNLDAVAELQWRLAIPLSIPLLTLIAVPLSTVNPRQGKFASMLPALTLYLGFYILLIVGRSAVENGTVPRSIGMWWIHVVALFIGISLLMKSRTTGNRLRSKIKKRPAK